MKKLFVLLLATAMIFAGCGKEEKTESKQINVSEIAKEISETEAFEDEISQIDKGTASMIFGFDEEKVSELECYMNTSATSEFILAIKTDESYLSDAKELITEYMNSEKENDASYNPKEVTKIENAVFEELGDNVVVVCVSNNSEAVSNVVEKY